MAEIGAMDADGDENNNKVQCAEVLLRALPGAMQDAGDLTFVTDDLRF